jgi:hypothetical protein
MFHGGEFIMKEQMVNLFNRVGLSRVAIDLADLMKTSIRQRY